MPSLLFTNNHTGSSSSADNFLPALHHAISGSAGTLISTCALYPLSLVITRLQAQRQLQREGRANSSNNASGNTTTTGPNGRGAATGPAQEPTYAGITEAFSRIWSSGGGPKAFYTGLGQDAVKSVLDSFLFFLFYEWFRSARLQASSRRGRGRRAGEVPGLGVLEELAVGMAAGACSRFFTTPIANVVTRKQTASFVDACGRDEVSVREIVDSIRKEGLSGFWSGYSASLVLTLNPSITFFLQEFLKKKTVSSEKWDNPGPAMTFLLAAISKSIASAVTYPFQTAKTRLQTGVPVAPEPTREVQTPKRPETPKDEAAAAEAPREGEEAAEAEGEAPAPDDVPLSPKSKEPPRKAVITHNVAPPERNTGADAKFEAQAMRAVKNFGKQSIFGTVAQIARTEGIRSLYDGLPAELLKGFLSHGTTMLAKGVVHRMLFRLYFIIAGALAEVRSRRARANTDVSTVAARAQEVMNRSALAPAPASASAPAPANTAPPSPAPTPALSEVSTTTVTETIETRALPALPAPEPEPVATPTSAPASEEASESASTPTPLPTPVSEQPAELPPLPSLPSPRSPQSLRSRSSSLLQGGAGRPLLPAPSPPSLAPPLLTLSTLPSSSSQAPTPQPSALAQQSSSSSRLSPPPQPQQPSQQLRALRYRLDNVDEWGPKARRPSFPISTADNGSAPAISGAIASASAMGTGNVTATAERPRRMSALDDFVVNVVANMIEGTQRGLKGGER